MSRASQTTDLLLGVQRIGHDIEQFSRLCLKFHCFAAAHRLGGGAGTSGGVCAAEQTLRSRRARDAAPATSQQSARRLLPGQCHGANRVMTAQSRHETSTGKTAAQHSVVCVCWKAQGFSEFNHQGQECELVTMTSLKRKASDAFDSTGKINLIVLIFFFFFLFFFFFSSVSYHCFPSSLIFFVRVFLSAELLKSQKLAGTIYAGHGTQATSPAPLGTFVVALHTFRSVCRFFTYLLYPLFFSVVLVAQTCLLTNRRRVCRPRPLAKLVRTYWRNCPAGWTSCWCAFATFNRCQWRCTPTRRGGTCAANW